MDPHYDDYHQKQMEGKGDVEDAEKRLLLKVEKCVICHII